MKIKQKQISRWYSKESIYDGILATMARNAQMSIGRKAFLIYLAVSSILFLYMHIMGVSQGQTSTMNDVVISISVILAGGTIYFLTKEKPA